MQCSMRSHILFPRILAPFLLSVDISSRVVFYTKLTETRGAIHSTKLSGNFGPKLNGSVRSNRKSFEKTGPPFEVVLFSRSDRLEFWLNGSRPRGGGQNTGYLSFTWANRSVHDNNNNTLFTFPLQGLSNLLNN